MKKKLKKELVDRFRAIAENFLDDDRNADVEGLPFYDLLRQLGYHPPLVIKFAEWVVSEFNSKVALVQDGLNSLFVIHRGNLVWDKDCRKFFYRGYREDLKTFHGVEVVPQDYLRIEE